MNALEVNVPPPEAELSELAGSAFGLDFGLRT